jgi:tetratricopeptide (TPR) repeat protein
VAERITRELTNAGRSVWFDRELPVHRAYSDVIAAELEEAGSVLVLWSKASAESQWVRSEANRARELGKLVQARLDKARLPMPFDQIQCGDLTNWRAGGADPGWKQVSRSIESLVGGEAPLLRRPESAPTRRGLLAGGGTAMLAAAAGGAWLLLRNRDEDHPTPESALLLQKGIDTLQNNDVFAADDAGSLDNAIAILNDATQADPRSAPAWGSLALAYSASKRVSPAAKRAGLDSRCRSAAAKALQLDPREPRATSAVLLIDPLYRHWASAERADRAAIRKCTPIPLLLFLLSETLGSVGRWKEAAEISSKFDRKKFVIPGADRRVIVDLWASGDLQGADEALKLAVEHWPQQPQVWRTRLAYLMYTGRASETLALLRDKTEIPAGTPDALVMAFGAVAKALAGQGDVDEARTRSLNFLKSQPAAALGVLQALAAVGDLNTCFAILQGYYFADGPWSIVAPQAGDQDRATSSLFLPSMKPIWADARFTQLLQRIGLEAYWRQSGTQPDFRR